jgi:hypothetical protein
LPSEQTPFCSSSIHNVNTFGFPFRLRRSPPPDTALNQLCSHHSLAMAALTLYRLCPQLLSGFNRKYTIYHPQLSFEVSRCVFTVQGEFSALFKKNTHHTRTMSFLNRALNTDLDTSTRSTQKAFSCCAAILETGPAAPQLTVCVVPV